MNEMKIVAVGGAGISIVKHVLDSGMKVSVLAIDKDDSLVKIMALSNVDFLIFDEGSESFENKFEGKIKDSKMVVIVGGAAGETSSRCIPIVAEISKKYTENVLCFASFPMDFEGAERVGRAEKFQNAISALGIKNYTASLQALLEQGFYKTQKEMFVAIGKEFLEILKKELRQ